MKKRLSVFLSLVLTVLFALSASAGALGDVDNNGEVSAADARAALRIAVGLENADVGSARFIAADADKNGEITAADARLILRAAVGLENLGNTDPVPAGDVLTRRQVYDIAYKYTVEITSDRDDGQALGSGFFISEDGRLLTNYHVIEDTNALTVTDYSGETYEVEQVLAFDRDIDMAVLKVKGPAPAWATLNKTDYSTADTVYALGSSNGYTGSFSEGMISTAQRPLEGYSDVVYIQHTAAISAGNSGGPLLDDHGRVIGMNTLGDDSGHSLYFAVPVSYLDELDFSNPMTVEDFSAAEANYKNLYFLEDYGESVQLHPNAIGAYVFTGYSRTEVTLEVQCDSPALDVSLGTIGWFYNGLFIIAKDTCENVPVTIYMKEAPEITLTLNVTVTEAAEKMCGGVLTGVPDFGAVTGVTPTFDSDTFSLISSILNIDLGDYSSGAIPTLVYRDVEVFRTRTADQIHADYDAALTAAGFKLSETSTSIVGGTTYSYYSSQLGITVSCAERRLLNRMQTVKITIG